MFCPKCNFADTQVVDSRPLQGEVRRRRICKNCGYRFTTAETARVTDIYVQKRNGTTELFSEEKIEKGIRKAFNKRVVDEEKMRYMLHRVVEDVIKSSDNPIKSKKVGSIVLNILRETDEVAYICFCAMFGNFDTVDDFSKLIKGFK
jgi:transcriptional repressor NrdR